jgi:hypothetical protein
VSISELLALQEHLLDPLAVGSRHNRSRGPYDPFYLTAVARPVILGKHRANCEKTGPLWSNKTDV